MKLGIIGITGRLGKRFAEEALKREFQVVGMNRRTERVEERLGELDVETFKGDTDNLEDIEKLVQQCDVVIHATAPTRERPQKYVEGIRRTLEVAYKYKLSKLIIIGNSFTLRMDNGKMFMENKVLRENFLNVFNTYPAVLEMLNDFEKVNWTVAIPPVNLYPYGEVTGQYNINNGVLGPQVTVENSDDTNRISMEEFSVIVIDEALDNKFNHKIFSASY